MNELPLTFSRIHLTWKEPAQIPKDLVAALSMSSYANNEINTFSRLFLLSNHDFELKGATGRASNAQSMAILRVLSAKLYEILEFYPFEGKYNRTKDEILLQFSKEAKARYGHHSKSQGFSIAKDLRHEATSHYYLRPARLNTDHIDDNTDCSGFVLGMEGNCFFSLGEEVLFEARIRRIASKIAKTENDLIFLWSEWMKFTQKWAQDCHMELTKKILLSTFPDKRFDPYTETTNPLALGPINRNAIPVFIYEPQHEK